MKSFTRNVFKLWSHVLCFGLTIIMLITFFTAYFAEYLGHLPYGTLVQINEYGEAHIEFLLLSIIIPVLIIGLIFTIKDFINFKVNLLKQAHEHIDQLERATT